MKTKHPKIEGQDKNIELLKTALEGNMPVLLVGETGSGKTGMVQYVSELQGRDVIRFNLTGDTTTDEFVGKLTLKDGATEWQDGVLLRAMKEGKVLVVDEINVALPEVLFVLNSLLDDGKAVVVSENEGEEIKPHKDFRFVATMNPTSEYSGTKELNKALLSRFKMILNVEYPTADVEEQIIIDRTGINKERAYQIVQVAQRLRYEKETGNIYYTCSTRDLLQWADVYETINGKRPLTKNLAIAFEISILNKAEKDERETLVQVFTEVTQATDKIIELIKADSGGDFLNINELKDIYNNVMREKRSIDAKKKELDESKKEYRESIKEEEYNRAKEDLQEEFESKFKEVKKKEEEVNKKLELIKQALK